jgi:AcrR family transcriptional regulator
MSSAAPSTVRRTADERRERILEAAERAFAAHGFHAATMQDVAEAAGMSAGNLYRTFPSKEAIVEGLCSRDQQERIDNFAHLADTGSVFAAFGATTLISVAAAARSPARSRRFAPSPARVTSPISRRCRSRCRAGAR